ncbi:hypothetical protein BK125_04785 [Paenibacillus odorifer]|uniref:Baseplate protein J-like domain-containing protein n=1 Tax=Paenibacillus odorifer TaxID=189426 RepID=A0ABX3GQS3_9BACL|nr:hypothetical protein [Paenibacillus odorifer]OMC79599.1 hypothetical protein BK125_04785 [Paenibacillus odorifer]OMD34945.1 hypothetical protein BSO21_10030 [Paenibacillus odorifer]
MGIWKMSQLKAPPQTNDAGELREYIKYFSNQIAIMLKDLDFTLNGDINFQNVKAKSITADRMDVQELSAIVANLGHITAGLIESVQIFGSYIATRNGAFPRAEINNTGDLLAVYTDANNYLTIEPGITGEPTVTIRKSGAVSLILGPAFGLTGLLASTPIVLGTQNGNTNIVCGDSDDVIIPSWSQFKNTETGTSLQAELDSIRAELAGKADI